MVTSPYFKNFTSERHQTLVESLILESIKKFGYDVKYIPRTIVNLDHIFGEDSLSEFKDAAIIEMYIKNVEGFGGQGRFMSKFGVEIRDQITFTVSRLRYEQARTSKILTEEGFTLCLEERNKYRPSQPYNIQLEDDSYELPDRPREGDLIYFPLVKKLFQITYANYESIFYQQGALQIYDLECELFEYSSEKIHTGYTEIDNIEQFLSGDSKSTTLLSEDGESLKQESGDDIVLEEFAIENSNPIANNSVFQSEADQIVDFSDINPLIIGDKFKKW